MTANMKIQFAAVLLLAATSARAACTEPPLCGPKDRCVAPATWRSCSPPPFDAPVRFGGEVTVSGQVYWLWLRDGPSSAPCTAKQATDGASYQTACAAKIGDELFRRARFK